MRRNSGGPFSELLERTLRTCEQRAIRGSSSHCPCSEAGQLHEDGQLCEDHTTAASFSSWCKILAVATKWHKNKVFEGKWKVSWRTWCCLQAGRPELDFIITSTEGWGRGAVRTYSAPFPGLRWFHCISTMDSCGHQGVLEASWDGQSVQGGGPGSLKSPLAHTIHMFQLWARLVQTSPTCFHG